MTHEEEFTLKVKFQDTYKAIANYIRNGLGIKREDVERYIQNFSRESISAYDFTPVIQDVIDKRMVEVLQEKYSYMPDKGLRSYIEKAIREEIERQVSKMVKEQVQVVLKEQLTGE